MVIKMIMQLHATQRSDLNYANQVEGQVKTKEKRAKICKIVYSVGGSNIRNIHIPSMSCASHF